MAETAKFRGLPEEEFGRDLARAVSGVRPGAVAAMALPGGITGMVAPDLGREAAAQLPEEARAIPRIATAPMRAGIAAGQELRGGVRLPSSVTIPAPPRPEAVTGTARRLDFGPAETPFFTNIPAVAEARGLRERADLPGVYSNIQGDFGKRGGGLSFANAGGAEAAGPVVATSPAAPAAFEPLPASARGIRADGTAMSSTELSAFDRLFEAQRRRETQARNPMQPVQAGELLRNISAENLTPAGISAAAALQAASERGIRQRVRDTQTMIEEERRMAEAETAAENAAINRENMLINRQRANLDLAKGIRELEQGPEVKLETVELGDVAGTKQTYVRTPQRQFVPFADYQAQQAWASASEDQILADARNAIAGVGRTGKANRAVVEQMLRERGIDPAKL